MSRLIRLVVAGCGLIMLLGWLSQQLQLQDTRAGEGGSVAVPVGLVVLVIFFGIGLFARLFGAGATANPEQRRREARLRTAVRRPVEVDRRGGAWEHGDFGGGVDGHDADEEGPE